MSNLFLKQQRQLNTTSLAQKGGIRADNHCNTPCLGWTCSKSSARFYFNFLLILLFSLSLSTFNLASGAVKATSGFISLSSSKAMRAVLICTLSASHSDFLNQQYLEYVYLFKNATFLHIKVLVLKMPIFSSSKRSHQFENYFIYCLTDCDILMSREEMISQVKYKREIKS